MLNGRYVNDHSMGRWDGVDGHGGMDSSCSSMNDGHRNVALV